MSIYRIVGTYLHNLLFNNQPSQFVSQFRYLSHIINNEFKDNDDEIKQEIRNLFMRTNVLRRRFATCSAPVKLMLFKTYCLCLYDAAFWNVYRASTLDKLNSAYNKCIKLFFQYKRRYSVTRMLQEIGLPTLSALINKFRISFEMQLSSSSNSIVHLVSRILVVIFTDTQVLHLFTFFLCYVSIVMLT